MKEEIISKHKPMGEYPSYYHECNIESMMDEWADKFALDFARFLEEHTEIIREEKITLYRYCDSMNEWGNYTLEDIFIVFKEKYE